MLNKKFLIIIMLMSFITFPLLSSPIFAEETEDVGELKKQIEALQKRVEELEEDKQQMQSEQQDDDFFWGSRNRWDPFYEMQRMQEEMNKMFQNSFNRRGSFSGGIFSNDMSFDYDFDMKELKDSYEITFDMKGLDQEKVDIEINNNSITVKGEHSSQEKEEGQGRYYNAKSFGSFMKTIPLPVDADTTKVKTEKEGDKLIIRLPKKKT